MDYEYYGFVEIVVDGKVCYEDSLIESFFILIKHRTIRRDFANTITQNIIHGSDSLESAKRELNLWFEEF